MSISRSLASLSLLLPLAAGACAADADGDPACAGDLCDEPSRIDACEAEGRYGDGPCDGTCALPDTDCFVFFDDHAAADSWFAAFESKLAASESRAPRGLVPESDPRFLRMRELLDRGWASYAEKRPVGRLDSPPELVVIDDATVNAFVAFDSDIGKIGWTVMVQTGLLELDASEPAILGVVMHELTHAVDRHVLPGTDERTRIHYQVGPGEPEPLGFTRADEPVARAAITTWRALGQEAGPYPLAELHGIPIGGVSIMSRTFNAALQTAVADDEAACAAAVARRKVLSEFLRAHISPLDNLPLPLDDAERAELDRLSSEFLAALREPCLAGSSLDFYALMAQVFGVTIEEVRAGIEPADAALIDGKPILDQITLLTEDRYRRMRELEATLATDTGGDTRSLRYYSIEEAADDSTVPVLEGMDLPPDAVGEFFVAILPEAAQVACTELLARDEVPPYGDLIDEHHAGCWRAYHVSALAESVADAGIALRRPSAPAAAAYDELAGARLPRFRRPADDTSSALHRWR
jgi:hypothetical protein